MRRQDFYYDLPDELIAYQPTKQRSGSRLMRMDGNTGAIEHQQFPQLIHSLVPGDVMVFNDTKVIPARLFGRKSSGGKVEVLVERLLSEYRVLAHVRSSKSPKVDTILHFDTDADLPVEATMVARDGPNNSLFVIDFGDQEVLGLLERIGHMPLPPYIEREDEPDDKDRYQTVYGREPGAVAAPTAGLHFDDVMLAAIKEKGVTIVYVTLHVGAGTFQPVRVDDIAEHVMHSEIMTITQETCDTINQAKAEGRRIIAVGTTSMRSLESAASFSDGDMLQPYQGETDIFITPGYRFNIVDALVTNFHLSESTLMMLVSAFAGHENIMRAYQEAVAERYRFFSYGDAMFLTRRTIND